MGGGSDKKLDKIKPNLQKKNRSLDVEKNDKKRRRSHSHSHKGKRSSSPSSTSSSSEERKKRRQSNKKKFKKTTSSDSSSNSSRSSSTDSSTDSEEEYKKKKLKKEKKKAKKLKKKLKKDKKKDPKKDNPVTTQTATEVFDVPLALMEKSKAMAPMTKEEWEKKQSVVRRVYDEESGRHRLIKGDGEIIEEIVSRDRHKAINKQATLGDGNYFQAKLGTNNQQN